MQAHEGFSAIETPALLLDLDALEANIRTMAEFFAGRKARLRPHFKTHKSPAICRLQVAAGAVGVCCATLSEAEVVLAAGIRNVLIANQIVHPAKIARLANLARSDASIGVCVDDARNVEMLSAAAARAGSTLDVLVEVDVGMGRCGVATAEEALELARLVAAAPGLRFAGIQAYEGHLAGVVEAERRGAGVELIVEAITRVKDVLERGGLPASIVSGGATGTYALTGADTPWTEIQAGSYVFMDTAYARLGLPFRSALTVLATVVHAKGGRAVTDAGLKACTTDHGLPQIKGHPELRVRLNEEHGIVEDPHGVLLWGQNIEYLPSHSCTTVNLHDRYVCHRTGRVEAVWPIPGRGTSQ